MNIKDSLLRFFGRCSKNGKMAFVLPYIHHRHKFPNLKNPKDLSEIWIKRVLDGKVNELSWLADKYAVRKYVQDKGLSDILSPLIAVYDSPQDIDFSELPNRFALKANFGAGYNIICKDKAKLNLQEVKKQVETWFEPKHYSESEQHYNLIPKRIVCEEFIDDGTDDFPVDYKFMCIRGKVHCVLCVSGREEGHGVFFPYNTKWEPLYDYFPKRYVPKKLHPRPANLPDMITVAERLAEGIDLVRVDLYSNGSRIWFGELTLTPSGCIFHRWTQKAIDEMGEIYFNG